jgi:hypothetical protein
MGGMAGFFFVSLFHTPESPVALRAGEMEKYLRAALFIQATYVLLLGLYLITGAVVMAVAEARDRGELPYLLDRPVPRGMIVGVKWGVMTAPAAASAWMSLPATAGLVYGALVWHLPEATWSATYAVYAAVVGRAVSGASLIFGVAALAVANALFWSMVLPRRGWALMVSLLTLVMGLMATDQQVSVGVMGVWLPYPTPAFTEAAFFSFQPGRMAASLGIGAGYVWLGQWALKRKEW